MSQPRRKVLFVDDDPEALAAYARKFRKRFVLDTAPGAIRGLEAVAGNGPYAVVVSDLRMPGLDGIEFFSRLKKACPDTVRIMLTGFADIRAAMDAVNTGHVFRFLAKPCSETELEEAIAAGVAQYGLVTAEREFLKGTLRGAIKVLTDLLALLNFEAHARSARIKKLVADMGRYLEMPEPWRLELAVMLSQIGCAVLPEDMLKTMRLEGRLDPERQRLFDLHPKIAADLLANIPRLGEVAEIVRYQEKRFDGGGPPPGGPSGNDLPLGSRLIKAALDYDRCLTSGRDKSAAVAAMRARTGWYDPKLLDLLETLAGGREGYGRAEVAVADLRPGMILDRDVEAGQGSPAGYRGQEVDLALIRELARATDAVATPIPVLVPPADDSMASRIDPELLEMLKRERARGGT